MPLTYNQTQYSTLTVTGTSPNQEATISYSTLDFRPEIGDTIEVYNDTTKLTETTNYTLDTSLKNVVLKVNTFSPGTTISVYRIAKKDTRSIDFQNASVLTEADLDNSAFQTFHIAQEALDTAESSITADADGSFDAGNKRIKNVVTPSSSSPDTDVATKGYVDGSSSAQAVAAVSSEIALLGTSAMATATTGHIPVLANVVEQTVNYTVTVSSSKFNIQGGEYGSATETPALTLIRGYTYVFDVSDSSVAGHPLVFMNGSSTLGTSDGVTTTGTAGQAGAKVTVVVSDSVTITKYSCSSHGDGMGNTITLRHDDFKEVADVASNVTTVAGVASSIPTVAGINSEITTVANSAYKTDIETVADSTYKAKVETVADSAYKAKVETVADSTYKGKVETVAGDTTAINSVYNNINSVSNFGDTYHPSIDSSDTSRTSSTAAPGSASTLSTLTEGDLWFDSVQDTLKVYDGSSWGAATSSISTVASTSEFTASDGQGTGNKFFAFTVDAGLEIVWLNGVKLKRDYDYHLVNSNTDTGTGVSKGQGATFIRMETVPGTNDILSVMGFGQIGNNLAVNVSGGTFTGGVTFEAGTTHNTGNNTFTMPTTRGTNNYVLTRDDSVGTGGTAWKQTTLPPIISSITYPTQNGVQATALAATGAQDTTAETLLINGQDFTSAVTVNISGNGVSSSAFAGTVSVNGTGTVITCSNVTKRASADNYTLTVTNSTGLNTTTTVNFSADPSFTTASGNLGTVYTGVTMSAVRVNAGSSVTWTGGATNKPNWMTVTGETSTTDNGLSDTTYEALGSYIDLGGTPTQVDSSLNSEIQNFNIIIRDSENQSHNRDFSLTVNDPPTGGDTGGSGSPSSGAYSIYQDGGVYYQVHRFTTTGANTLTLYGAVTADILVIAGGGSGGGSGGRGAGGAGGLRWFTGQSLVAGDYTCTVGAGGGTPPNSDTVGYNGSDSSFIRTGANAINISATGGGAGGGSSTDPDRNGNNGGSSGGANWNGTATNGNLGNYTPVEGYRGGNASTSGNYGGGGGGGAGGVGGDGSGTEGGAGGEGASNFLNQSEIAFTQAKTTAFLAAAGAGEEVSSVRYIAGGGGGGIYTGGSSKAGGHGGGGNGGYGASTAGTNGTASTGGGGGGGTNSYRGGTGGSGIIIIRYAI